MSLRVTTLAAFAGTVVLAGLFAPGRAGAQALAPDVFAIEHFANIHTTVQTSEDATVRITNPGDTGLRAWGTHVEDLDFITETPFQIATLSGAELNSLVDKCEGIRDNGSGFGICTCGPPESDSKTAPPGTLCALLYVFTADQQMAECCGCPVTPNGLITLSVANDLTDNPLTPVKPQTGVIKLVSSIPPSTGPCDPTAPTPPAGQTTTTVTSTTGTSTTGPTATVTSTTATTAAPPTTTTMAAHSSCRSQSGFDQLDCELQTMAAPPLCDLGSISPPFERHILRKLNALRSRLEQAHQRGGKAFNRAVNRTKNGLSGLQQALANAVKRQRISASCEAVLNQQLDGLRLQTAALRQ